MKGLLGKKAGMTSVFTDHGINIPVTVIEVQENVVTHILTKEKNGYNAVQIGSFDRREKTSTKPEIGHLKKADTKPKYFVKEIRGMEGYKVGDKIKSSIFNAGELVDVTGTSKGKGFQGAIKRHNQSIGPKSHGGGGGSKPVRQTGSLGDVVSNRVFKGTHMPGHMGFETKTVQNLEIIAIDEKNNFILVKGSIPGPRKGFVIVREAVKGLDSKDAVKLVDVNEAAKKNELLEEAKKWGADINTDMSVEDMTSAINAAKEAHEAEQKAKEAKEASEKAEQEAHKIEEAAAKAHDDEEKAKKQGNEEAAKEAAAKAESLDKQKAAATAKVEEAKEESKEAEQEATAKEKEAEKLQVETEQPAEESKPAASKEEGGE